MILMDIDTPNCPVCGDPTYVSVDEVGIYSIECTQCIYKAPYTPEEAQTT